MTFCRNCGQKVNEGVKFCPSCGTPLQVEATQPVEEPASGSRDIEQNKAMAILCYLGILVFIPILAAKESKFARYHANQGLILFMALAGWWIVENVLVAILSKVLWQGIGTWGAYSFLMVILNLIYIIFVVLAILGISNVLNGKTKELPVIGKFVILK